MLGAGSMPDEFFKPQADLHKICLQFFLFKRQGLRIIRLIQPQAFFQRLQQGMAKQLDPVIGRFAFLYIAKIAFDLFQAFFGIPLTEREL